MKNVLLIHILCTAILSNGQSRTLGNKSYEVSNHLGNVMTVVNDRKTPTPETTNAIIAFNETDIKAFNDYYPYGMLLNNRNGITDYRFGFQGQEKDDEIKGENNSINYNFRMHDPRLGRFFAVDPLSEKYPYYSSYQFSGNRTIAFVELEGLEPGVPPISMPRILSISKLTVPNPNDLKTIMLQTFSQTFMQNNFDLVDNGNQVNVSGPSEVQINGSSYVMIYCSDCADSKGRTNQTQDAGVTGRTYYFGPTIKDSNGIIIRRTGDVLDNGSDVSYDFSHKIAKMAKFKDIQKDIIDVAFYYTTNTTQSSLQNDQIQTDALVSNFQTLIDENKLSNVTINITGFTSSDGSNQTNARLRRNRVNDAYNRLRSAALVAGLTQDQINNLDINLDFGSNSNNPIQNLANERASTITFNINE